MSVATASQVDDLQATPESLGKQMRSRHALDQVGRLAVLVMLLVAGVGYLVVPFQATGLPFQHTGWLRQPFIGAFVDHSLRINDGVGPTTATPFASLEAGLTLSDRIVTVDGQPVRTSAQLYEYVSQFQTGDPVVLQVASDDGGTREVTVRLMRLPAGDIVSRLVMPYIVGLVYLGIGLWVHRSRHEQASARAFLLMCASIALVLGTIFDLWRTQALWRLWVAAIPLAAATTIGQKRLLRFDPVTTGRVRLTITESRWCPTIARFGLFDSNG